MLGNWQTSECKSWLLAVLLAVAVTPHGHPHTHTRADHIALNWVFGYSKVAQSDESWRRHPNIQTSFSSSFSSSRATCRRIVASSFVALLFLLHSLVYTVGQTGTGRGSRAGHRRDSNLQRRPFCSFPLIVQCPLAVCFLFLSSWNCLTHLQSIGRPLELL